MLTLRLVELPCREHGRPEEAKAGHKDCTSGCWDKLEVDELEEWPDKDARLQYVACEAMRSSCYHCEANDVTCQLNYVDDHD